MADSTKKLCPWVEAGNDPVKRKDAVIKDPSLRHVYAAAAEIYNQLTDAEKAQASTSTQPN